MNQRKSVAPRPQVTGEGLTRERPRARCGAIEHLGWDGWRESSRRRRIAGDGRIGRSLDDLVRPPQHGWRDSEPERLRGLKVDDKLELRRSHDRQVRGLRSLEDLVYVAGRVPK